MEASNFLFSLNRKQCVLSAELPHVTLKNPWLQKYWKLE